MSELPQDMSAANTTCRMMAQEEPSSSSSTSSSSFQAGATIHVMVLVHGVMGNHKELSYLQDAIERETVRQSPAHTRLMVYAASCNEGNTLDGIEAGGRRLAEEINAFLRTTVIPQQQQQQQQASCSPADTTTTITFSILGNSLGGLYARYALAYLDWEPSLAGPPATAAAAAAAATAATPEQDGRMETTQTITVLPNVFATTATPHLGLQNMTYWKVPRQLEPMGAWYMKQTGSDLFRFTDVVQRLCLDRTFLDPLSRFAKRRLWANAFSTDAAVPTATAAFLTNSDYPHRVMRAHDEGTTVEASLYPMARLEVLADENENDTRSRASSKKGNKLINQHYNHPSVEAFSDALDSLGWTKIFVDVRSHIPALWRRGTRRRDLEAFQPPPPLSYTTPPSTTTMTVTSSVFSSAELKQRLSTFDWNTLPFGHSFLVANAKNPAYAWFYKGGRPLVDFIARELVQEIMSFTPPPSSNRTTTATTTTTTTATTPASTTTMTTTSSTSL